MDFYKQAQNRVKALAFQVEKKLGVQLEDIAVKEYPEAFQTEDNSNSGSLMKVLRGDEKNVYMNTPAYNARHNLEESWHRIGLDLTHELTHLAHIKMVRPNVFWRKSPPAFREGFSEYVSTHLIFTSKYDSGTIEYAVKPRLDCLELSYAFYNLYVQGYQFFKKVLGAIGEDKLLEVARAPPLNEREVKYPILYLLKNYPTKGLKSIPKFAKNHVWETFKAYNLLKCGRFPVIGLAKRCLLL